LDCSKDIKPEDDALDLSAIDTHYDSGIANSTSIKLDVKDNISRCADDSMPHYQAKDIDHKVPSNNIINTESLPMEIDNIININVCESASQVTASLCVQSVHVQTECSKEMLTQTDVCFVEDVTTQTFLNSNKVTQTKYYHKHKNNRAVQSHPTSCNVFTQTVSSTSEMVDSATSTQGCLHKHQSTATELPVSKHVQTVQYPLKTRSVLVLERYHKSSQTESIKKQHKMLSVSSKVEDTKTHAEPHSNPTVTGSIDSDGISVLMKYIDDMEQRLVVKRQTHDDNLCRMMDRIGKPK
jgi:hypothetical protein